MSKIKRLDFQRIVNNETITKEIFPTYSTVFVMAYEILEAVKNTSATIGWYNQLVAPVASKAKDNTINTNQNKRLFSAVHQEKSSKSIRRIILYLVIVTIQILMIHVLDVGKSI